MVHGRLQAVGTAQPLSPSSGGPHALIQADERVGVSKLEIEITVYYTWSHFSRFPVYKTFFMLNAVETKFILLINVGILTFLSRVNY